MNIIEINSANNLNADWDLKCNSIFQTRNFLLHCEKYNKCNQRYFELYINNQFVSGAIFYTLKMDLFTFAKISSPLKFNIIGIPCSVSPSGMIGNKKHFNNLITHIKKQNNGLLLILNCDNTTINSSLQKGNTLPTIVFQNDHSNFDDYIQKIRSSYRRRYKLITSKFTNVKAETISCIDFTIEMHDLYLNVLNKSKGKLESLTFDFFKNLPDEFQLHTFRTKNTLIGWCITVPFMNTFIFFIGGIDYSINDKYSTYFNILFHILKKGINGNYKLIEFGQTAEIPKLRLGGELVEKKMFASHSNKVLNKILGYCKGFLEYSTEFQKQNIFRSDI